MKHHFKIFQNAQVQKIFALEDVGIILALYIPKVGRFFAVLGIKKNNIDFKYAKEKPLNTQKTQGQNSFVQLARKYVLDRKIAAVYATPSYDTIFIEFKQDILNENTYPENIKKEVDGDSRKKNSFRGSSSLVSNSYTLCLILDSAAKPARLILAKKYTAVPDRYQKDLNHLNDFFSLGDLFFESLCEWTTENTKTKARACFVKPIVTLCPLVSEEETKLALAELKTDSNTNVNVNSSLNDVAENSRVNNSEKAITEKTAEIETYENNESTTKEPEFPVHIRRAIRTKLQFLERRLKRQEADLPKDDEILAVEKQSLDYKNHMHLWPKTERHVERTWHVPEEILQTTTLDSVYTLKMGQKPSSLLEEMHHKIHVLKRRTIELNKRIAQSNAALAEFKELLLQSQESPYLRLCEYLDIEPIENKAREQKIKLQQKRLPFRTFKATTGEFIRVAKSADDGDQMLKLMPSHHFWFHILTGEGSHVWLEKLKSQQQINPVTIRQACILALHNSKNSKTQKGEVRMALRQDIEKRKKLAPGKVLIRRSQTIVVEYSQKELRAILDTEVKKNELT